MATRRLILLGLTTLLGVAAFLLATSDVHAGQTNCGSALLPRDTKSLSLDTGDVARDDFSVEEVAADCGRNILRQRYLLMLSIVAAAISGAAASRSLPPVEELPGDPIV
ncbi:MAG: hypothetical protein IT195_08425 [Microthrixaceae bacterium]|nr:hypothetical protein [Microthrixaceae bacterium]